jgi:hydroxymethylbilane synthase
MTTTFQPSPAKPFRIGSRGSPLALVQAHMVADALRAAHGWDAAVVNIVTVTTSGDRIQDRALAEIGGKALWTKELDRALLEGEIDCAVHSMKDVETIRPEAIAIAAMLARAETGRGGRDQFAAPGRPATPPAAGRRSGAVSRQCRHAYRQADGG